MSATKYWFEGLRLNIGRGLQTQFVETGADGLLEQIEAGGQFLRHRCVDLEKNLRFPMPTGCKSLRLMVTTGLSAAWRWLERSSRLASRV